MKILMIPSFFRTQDDPTLGEFFFNQAKALIKLGHHVDIVYCDTYSVKYLKKYFHYREKEVEHFQGIGIYRCRKFAPLKRKSGMKGNRQVFCRGIRRLFQRYLADQEYDLIHAQCCLWGGAAARELSQVYGIPYVVTEHSSVFALHPEDIGKRDKILAKQIYEEAGQVICVSKTCQDSIHEYCKRSCIIGNAIDLDIFEEQSLNEKDDSAGKVNIGVKSDFVFMTLCYMKNEAQLINKGIPLLLQAFGNVVQKYDDCRLYVGGGGDGEKMLRHLVEEMGLSEKIVLGGALTQKEVAEQLGRCDCFVLPSRYETFGVAYVEAMAMGKPVIAAQSGGPEYFIDESLGIIVPKDDLEKLTEAMFRMIEEYDGYDPQELKKAAREKFSLQAVGKQLVELYQKEIIKKNG